MSQQGPSQISVTFSSQDHPVEPQTGFEHNRLCTCRGKSMFPICRSSIPRKGGKSPHRTASFSSKGIFRGTHLPFQCLILAYGVSLTPLTVPGEMRSSDSFSPQPEGHGGKIIDGARNVLRHPTSNGTPPIWLAFRSA
jgi:hypothetical protein